MANNNNNNNNKAQAKEDPFQHLQHARKELQHHARTFANAQEKRPCEAAGHALERAALAFALAAAQHGLSARPLRLSDVFIENEGGLPSLTPPNKKKKR